MASFNADIYLKLVTQEAERALKSFENKLSRVENRQQRLNRAASRLPGVGGTGRAGAGVGAGVKASPGRGANNLSREIRVLGQADERRLVIAKKVRAENLADLATRKKFVNLQRELQKIQRSYAADKQKAAKQAEREAKATQKTAAATQKAAKTKRNRGLQSAALGVGFPLLFGGGAGSVAGGLLGSVGGFGGQILGSAIGQQIDNAVQGIAKLGQALNPLTADIDAVVKAVGESGTEFEKLVKDLEEVAGAEAALEIATAKLAITLGQGGVSSVKQFGEDTAELGNTFAVTLNQIGLAVAELINKTGVLRQLINGLEERNDLRAGRRNTADPTLRRLNQQFDDLKGEGVFARGADDPELVALERRIAARQREITLIQEKNIAENANALRQESLQQNALVSERVARAELAVAESNLDITTDQGFALAKKVIEARKYERLQEAINKGAGQEAAVLQEQLDLLNLKNRRQELIDRQNERERREAAQARDKEQQVRSQINGIQASAFKLRVQQIQLTAGEEAALTYQLSIIKFKYEYLQKQIELSKQDSRLKDLQIQKLGLQKTLEKEQLNSRLRAIDAEKEILKLKQQQALAGISTDIGRQTEDANFRGTGNAAQDEQLQLRIDQTRRAEDVTTRLNNALAEQQAIINNPANADQAMRAEETRQNLQAQLDLYNQLLPQLNAAEQAQLRYNQVLQAAQPYAEAFATGLTQGLRDVVAGTKTAEEAFADFLNNIADMLIQTAATMIAQYIAIGIARAFAGIGGATDTKNMTGFFNADVFKAGPFSGFSPVPFAEGGYVTSPTRAVIGEAGEPEYVIPASKMNESMARYSAGSRGNSVVPNNATGGGNGASPAGGGAPLFNLETQVINNVEYATVQDVRAMGAQATSAGAKQGEARVMSSLKNSRARRSKLGL